ncbi:hypothetical protein EYR40_003090 [Pleurotus pulmonarius]|nr:hypothetical protein EYR36_005538 [Pleurotus pulmonarius]KAF4580691.1 hypothetical protein EYR40_003090 [Pleurotus pulmonarius]
MGSSWSSRSAEVADEVIFMASRQSEYARPISGCTIIPPLATADTPATLPIDGSIKAFYSLAVAQNILTTLRRELPPALISAVKIAFPLPLPTSTYRDDRLSVGPYFAIKQN